MASPSEEVSPIDDQLLQSHYQAWSTFLNTIPSMALRCALQLRIPDVISGHHGVPVTLPELIPQLSIAPAKSSHLHRLMQLLVHLGYFAMQKNDQDQEGYVPTSSSKLLLSPGNDRDQCHPSLVPFFTFISDPFQQEHCSHLADWFQGPHFSAFETAHGIGILEHMEKHPEATTVAIEANASNSEVEMRGLIKHLIPKLEGFETLVDIGGGSGAVAGIIAEAVPHLKCSVFDLPDVVSQAKPRDGITFLAGDVLEFIPSADVIFFKGTMTMFSDEKGVNVLTRCRQAIQGCKNGGKVLMIEKVANQRRPTFESTKIQLCYDLHVMTFGGDERNETEWKKLFLDAGFTRYKITQTLSINSIIEVFP